MIIKDHIFLLFLPFRELSDVSPDELIFTVHQNEDYLRDIFQGKVCAISWPKL